MDAQLTLPGIPAAPERPAVPLAPAVVHIDLDFWDEWKVARVWSPYDHGGR